MATCSNDFSFLVEQIRAFKLQNFELFTHAERTFTSVGVETRVLLDRAPGNVVGSSKALDVPDFL